MTIPQYSFNSTYHRRESQAFVLKGQSSSLLRSINFSVWRARARGQSKILLLYLLLLLSYSLLALRRGGFVVLGYRSTTKNLGKISNKISYLQINSPIQYRERPPCVLVLWFIIWGINFVVLGIGWHGTFGHATCAKTCLQEKNCQQIENKFKYKITYSNPVQWINLMNKSMTEVLFDMVLIYVV